MENGIGVGDWVTCFYAGYWQVVEIKQNVTDSHFSDRLAIVKKGFTPKMKFQAALKFCDLAWCKRIGEGELRDITGYFEKNPDKRREFEAYDGPLYGVTKGWVVDLDEAEVPLYNEKLAAFPQYFSLRQFQRLTDDIGLRKHLFPSSRRAKYLLTVVTYPWLADEKTGSPLYFLERGIYEKPQPKKP